MKFELDSKCKPGDTIYALSRETVPSHYEIGHVVSVRFTEKRTSIHCWIESEPWSREVILAPSSFDKWIFIDEKSAIEALKKINE